MISFSIYLISFCWLLGFYFLWRIPRLEPPPVPAAIDPSEVSIIVPARNEANNLQILLDSLRSQYHLPDRAGVFKERGFPKKELKNKNKKYLLTFQIETCRGELTHWFIMLFAPLFFLWNPFFVGWIMIVYAAAENIPLIMTQRYNRHRLDRILKRKRPAEFI